MGKCHIPVLSVSRRSLRKGRTVGRSDRIKAQTRQILHGIRRSHSTANSKRRKATRSLALPLYQPLRRRSSIRVLIVSPGVPQDQIVCSLRVIGDINHRCVNTNKATTYEAISYVWGTPHDNTEILCDGHSVSVTRNLADVLQRVRRRDQPRCVWADAICIDQGNVVEKGFQVGMMGEIYGKAERVLIWAGKDEGSNARSAFRLMKEISQGGIISQVSLELLKLEMDDLSELTSPIGDHAI
jgi:hypothetical protein